MMKIVCEGRRVCMANYNFGCKLQVMKLIFELFAHLTVTLARLLGPGGLKAVVAQNLLLKQQLLMVQRRRRRALSSVPANGCCSSFGRCFCTRNGFYVAP